MSFADLHSPLATALAARGYSEPTPVQAAVLEAETTQDMIVSAQTGSGKTVAFGIAIATQLLDAGGTPERPGAPLALLIAPTRELALQVSRELMWLYEGYGLRVATCVGGMDASRERRMLGQGAQVVVGTPGRLKDHFERGALNLSAIRAVVLDEADEMLDMGFREDLETLLDGTPAERRTLLFSATMPKPIVALARRYQRDALRISTVDAARGHGDIDYQVMSVAPRDLEGALVNLLRFHDAETAIVFASTREEVRRIHGRLVERGFAAVALSGEHSQNERNQALQALRDRRARLCVATDVAARGIDLPGLSLVVHVDLPRDAEALQHRSGRTGRAGSRGTAVLLVPHMRRRRVELLLRDARITAEFISAPDAAAVHAKDQVRLLERLRAPVEIDEADRAMGAELLAILSAEDIAARLVQAHRGQMPAPESIATEAPDALTARGHRAGFEDVVWFRVDIGRRQNADPRWLLPVLCRRGEVSRSEVGAIRIGANESHVGIPRAVADRFAAAVRRTAGDPQDRESAIAIIPSEGPPAAEPRTHRPTHAPSHAHAPGHAHAPAAWNHGRPQGTRQPGFAGKGAPQRKIRPA